MSGRIEDYALIGNCAGAALVGLNGSIDWLSLPRFDSAACLAALLGTDKNGRWQISPKSSVLRISRAYRSGTMVLETRFETASGAVVVVDAMGRRDEFGEGFVVRMIRCEGGSVPMTMRLSLRPSYGSVVPWMAPLSDGRISAVAGPDRFVLDGTVPLQEDGHAMAADFTMQEGDQTAFSLTWSHSYVGLPRAIDAGRAVAQIESDWLAWGRQFRPETAGRWSEPVLRSLITLKALSHHETGGIVAAPTTSLPETIGGTRNWDYRFCWLRDSTLTLRAFVGSGFLNEAAAWRDWLVRAVSGSPADMQIMYGVAGERRLQEYELDWLQGYEGSKPVRAGNAAVAQQQLDVYGEVVSSMYEAHRRGLDPHLAGWDVVKALLIHLEATWREPDEGIWEVRGGRRQFTASKVMVWIAFDSAVKAIEHLGMEGPVERWREQREAVHQEVCAKGYDADLGSFTRVYGSKDLDASLLILPVSGFLPATDTRIVGTVDAIAERLEQNSLIRRYADNDDADGIGGGPEGAFLACSFWMVEALVKIGRQKEAETLFEHLLTLTNDVGLLAEEYDVVGKRQVGNFPQAFSHVALVIAAQALCGVADS